MMHTGCLGVVQCLAGNVLWEVFLFLGGSVGKPEQTLAKILSMLWAAAKGASVELPIRHLTLGMIRSDANNKSPKLKVKAAEGRRLLPVLTFILEHLLPVTSPREVMRLQCAEALAAVCAELEPDGVWNSNRNR